MAQFPFREPVDTLYLPEEAVREERWVEALNGAFDYLYAVSDGEPTQETVDDNLLRVCEFCGYTGEVHNGGHGQYLDNDRPSIATLERLKEDMDRLGSPAYAAIFADFVQAVRSLPPGKDHTDGSFTGCDLLAPLDKRYFALWWTDPIERHMVAFLTEQPWVRQSPERKIVAAREVIRKLRHLKRRATMPSAEGIAQFVDFTQRFFTVPHGRT